MTGKEDVYLPEKLIMLDSRSLFVLLVKLDALVIELLKQLENIVISKMEKQSVDEEMTDLERGIRCCE